MIIDPMRNSVVAGARFNLSAEDVVEYCASGGAAESWRAGSFPITMHDPAVALCPLQSRARRARRNARSCESTDRADMGHRHRWLMAAPSRACSGDAQGRDGLAFWQRDAGEGTRLRKATAEARIRNAPRRSGRRGAWPWVVHNSWPPAPKVVHYSRCISDGNQGNGGPHNSGEESNCTGNGTTSVSEPIMPMPARERRSKTFIGGRS